MSKSRIAFICPSKAWGGLEMNVFRLSIWLNERGHNILLYCTPNTQLAIQSKEHGIETRELTSDTKIQGLWQALALSKSLKKENVRLVLFHLNKHFPMMTLAKIFSLNFFKLVYMQHMHLGGSKNDFFHRLQYKQLDCWIAPLEMFSERLQEISSIKKSQIEVIPFGIVLDKFIKCSYTKSEARQQLKLPEDKLLVGFVGRLDPKKCQHLLIETAYKLLQKGIEIQILLVGDSTKNEEIVYKQTLETMIEKYSLSNQIHFRSHLDNVEIAFKSLDVFCLTTGSETYGMVTIEAMASGLTVIGSNDGGTTEIIQNGKNGLLYKSGSSDEIVEAIEILIDNKELQEQLANQALLDAQQKYSHTVQCDALEKCFERFI